MSDPQMVPRPWKPTAEHDTAAHLVSSDAADKAVDAVLNAYRWHVHYDGVGELSFEDPTDPPADISDTAREAYAGLAEGWDPEETDCVTYLDESGRRYEVRIEVWARPLPPVEITWAQRQEELRRMELYKARAGAQPTLEGQ